MTSLDKQKLTDAWKVWTTSTVITDEEIACVKNNVEMAYNIMSVIDGNSFTTKRLREELNRMDNLIHIRKTTAS